MNKEQLDLELKTILPKFIDLFKKKYPFIYEEINNIMIYSEKEYNNMLGPNRYVSKENTITLVKNFLKDYYPDYYILFEEALKHDGIELFTKEELLLEQKRIIDKLEYSRSSLDSLRKDALNYLLKNQAFNTCIWKKGTELNARLNNCNIMLLLNNDISDSFYLIHEFTHFITSYSGIDDDFEEVQSIFSEYLLYDFLEKEGINNDRYLFKNNRDYQNKYLFPVEKLFLKVLALDFEGKDINCDNLDNDLDNIEFLLSILGDKKDREEKFYILVDLYRYLYANYLVDNIYETNDKDKVKELYKILNEIKRCESDYQYKDKIKDITSKKTK